MGRHSREEIPRVPEPHWLTRDVIDVLGEMHELLTLVRRHAEGLTTLEAARLAGDVERTRVAARRHKATLLAAAEARQQAGHR